MAPPVNFSDPTAVVAYYNVHYPQDCSQLSEAGCSTCCIVTAMQARYLFANGTPMPFLSWPYAYYVGSGGDSTFAGTGGTGPPVNVWAQGVCADVYYPQAQVIADYNNGFPYPPEDLPQPPAYADAPNQKILDYGTLVNGSIAETLQSGIPVMFVVGYHAMTAIAVSPDGYTFYCKDSLQAGAPNPGGRGIRLVNRDQISTATAPLPVTSVYWSAHAPNPPENALSTAAEINAAMSGGSWTTAEKGSFETTANAIVPNDLPPPSSSATILPPNPIPVDAAGNVWTWGAFVSDRFGWELHLGGRGLKTCLAVAIVNGVLRANDPGGGPTAQWYMFTGTAAAPAWTPTSAP